MGEGENMATQLVTAINKLVYKWYNDGDVYDNTFALQGWANDLSSYANWIYKHFNESKGTLNKIETAIHDRDYEFILKDLADNFLDEKLLAELSQKEKTSPFQAAEKIGDYLYEPNAAILKSGAFKLIATEYNISKLHLNSHLYTSGQKIGNFPGRIFKVASVHEFSGKKLKQLGKSIGQANITTRNFPLTVEAIRKSSGITEGGEVYLFATTLGNARKIIIECRKI